MAKLSMLDVANILNDMATILDCAAILRGDPNQGTMLANELDAYVEDCAKTTAARIVKEGTDNEH